jgi:hypothetical protein
MIGKELVGILKLDRRGRVGHVSLGHVSLGHVSLVSAANAGVGVIERRGYAI